MAIGSLESESNSDSEFYELSGSLMPLQSG